MERGLKVTSPDPMDDVGQLKFDCGGGGGGEGLSPLSSRYSLCGESEFERYCSANSMMGTPSVCSSMSVYNDFGESDFGSVKSLEGLTLGGERTPRKFEGRSRSLLSRETGFVDSGDDERGGLDCVGAFRQDVDSSLLLGHEGSMLETVGGTEGAGIFGGEHSDDEDSMFEYDSYGGLRGGGEGVFERKVEVVDAAKSSSSRQGGGANGAMPTSVDNHDIKGVNAAPSGETKEDLAFLLKNVENVLLQGAVAARSAAETLLDCNHADEMEDERCREEDEVSSRCEHSEGEDSMFNFGSDDGSQAGSYYVRNIENGLDENAKNENPVVMNSSVAFGSNDWEDFELEGGEHSKGIGVPQNLWEQPQGGCGTDSKYSEVSSTKPTYTGSMQLHELERNERQVTAADDLLIGSCKLGDDPVSSSSDNNRSLKHEEAGVLADVKEDVGTCRSIHYNDGSDDYLESCDVYSIFEKQSPLVFVSAEMGNTEGDKIIDDQGTARDKTSDHDQQEHQHLDCPPDTGVHEALNPLPTVCTALRLDVVQTYKVESTEVDQSTSVSSLPESSKGRISDVSDVEELADIKGKDFEMNALDDDFVHEMEEILRDSCNSPGARLKQRHTLFHFEHSSPARDGGSTASTSSFDDGYSMVHQPLRINGIEVVGARQKKGDVSLSERLVGVREYTVYIIRLWSGKDHWEVERRYRDFYTLYRQLKAMFASQGWILPPAWTSVEQESRKIFGNSSPAVVAERTNLIQDCLCSILKSKYYSSPPSALIWFLSPPESLLGSGQSKAVLDGSPAGGANERISEANERVSNLGKTISLVVEIRLQKSVKELLDTQRYTCAGCYKHFYNSKTRVQEFVQTFGWGKPRLCEYTGQLFCSSCHSNDTAVLPARVLHHWDFDAYSVSQLAKSYLDSIIDQPMLCVSAANPFLFSKVPMLLHVVGVRRKIGSMLPYIRCSFRRSIYKRLGYRKYLLESKDFFALRDLIDLSKGAFAALPAILEAVLKKTQEHITELCLECCEGGVPCGARQACNNPSSLIFPFQEEEDIKRCKSCKTVFHNHCFDKLIECPCGALLKVGRTPLLNKLELRQTGSTDGSLSLSEEKYAGKSTTGLFSSLFSVVRQEKLKGQPDKDNFILMGSLPSSAL